MALRLLTVQLLVAIFVPSLAEIEIEFTSHPESVTAPVGDKVTFECVVRVPGELAWRWRPADRPIEDWKIMGASEKEQGTESARLMIEVKDDTKDAFYQCVVSYGAVSLASIPARLTVARLDLSNNSQQKRVVTSPLNNTVVLHCKEPKSEPPAILSWWKEVNGIKKHLDAVSGVLVLQNVSADDTGKYGCTATNELSSQVINLPEKTYLKVQHEDAGGVRFLEQEEYVGIKAADDTLSVHVKINETLRLWCGAIGTPPPRVTWSRDGHPGLQRRHEPMLLISQIKMKDKGTYSCSAGGIKRSWKVIPLEPPSWMGSIASVNASEGGSARIACGTPIGEPTPDVHWLLNAEPLRSGRGVNSSGSELYIDRVEKRHAGIVQCFACNVLGCAYDAALLGVVPRQISDQEYNSAEVTRPFHFPSSQPRKKHGRKTNKKNKAEMVPPSRPNVTRMTDDSVMLSWTHPNRGLTIQFYKVQYREATNSSIGQWHTPTYEIPPNTNACQIDGLTPDRFYKFRIAAVYSNQDNKQGHSTNKFLLQRGKPSSPRVAAPILTKAEAISPKSIQVDWTWSSTGIEAQGFYVYSRAVSSAGVYSVSAMNGAARSIVLNHLETDTAYEVKVQSYTEQAPSEFSSIKTAKTLRSANAPGTTSEAPIQDVKGETPAPGAMVTVGGALGAAALLVILVVTLLLCRRAKRPAANKEKVSVPETGGANGYIPAKVPITITANPMHAEGGDGGVEMSFLHNNNCGNNGGDDTLARSRKNGPTNRQYV